MSKILITKVGIAEILNAEQSGTGPVKITSIAFGSGKYVATVEQTTLREEFKRIDAIAGGAVSDNVIHMTASDSSEETYAVYELGVFTETGILLAVYSQSTPILQKASKAEALVSIDIALTDFSANSVTFGETSFNLAPATDRRVGVVRFATNLEVEEAKSDLVAVSPRGVQIAINRNKPKSATQSKDGVVRLATDGEAEDSTCDKAVATPKNVHHIVNLNKPKNASTTQVGVVRFATETETSNGVEGLFAVSPSGLKKALAAAMLEMIPAGNIFMYAGTTRPDGFLVCNGGEVSRTKFARLFAAIGTKWGDGDKTSTFNLPDLHRRFAEFTTLPEEVGQKIEAGLPDISGSFELRRSFSDGPYFSAAYPIGSFNVQKSANKATAITLHPKASAEQMEKVIFEGSRANSTLGASSTVQPASVRLLPVIKI